MPSGQRRDASRDHATVPGRIGDLVTIVANGRRKQPETIKEYRVISFVYPLIRHKDCR
jgi:hypothetical protein